MKKFIFLMMASAFLFSCSNNDDSPSNESTPKSGVTFEVSAVNNLTNGMGSRGALYSQEAVQNAIFQVLQCAFLIFHVF